MYIKLYTFKMNFKIYYYIYLKPILMNEGESHYFNSGVIYYLTFLEQDHKAFVVNPQLTIEQKQQIQKYMNRSSQGLVQLCEWTLKSE